MVGTRMPIKKGVRTKSTWVYTTSLQNFKSIWVLATLLEYRSCRHCLRGHMAATGAAQETVHLDWHCAALAVSLGTPTAEAIQRQACRLAEGAAAAKALLLLLLLALRPLMCRWLLSLWSP